MAQQTIDNQTLVESLFEVFRNRGYEGTSISQLAEVTGLKKSSLYHRFPAGKDDMVKAVVLHVSEQIHKYVIEPLLKSEETPEKRFKNMVATLKAFYCDGAKNCLLNALSLGFTNDEIQALLNKDYNAWRLAIVKLALDAGFNQQQAEERAVHFIIVVQGSLVVQRLTKDFSTFQKSMEYAELEFFKNRIVDIKYLESKNT